MISIEKNIGCYKGSPRELSLDLVHILMGLSNTLIKEFNLSEDEAKQIIAKCAEIAFMDTEQRLEILNELQEDII